MLSRYFLAGRLSSALMGSVLTAVGGLSAPVQVQTSLSVMAVVVIGGSFASTPASAATVAKSNIVELSPTPPNVTQAVPPNIVVTFDDSGSMASNYMGDNRPFDDGGWGNNLWRCAGVIDPRITADTDLRSRAMNGVFYNPNVTYSPPMKADGTSFPNADSTLKKVWDDGIVANRPRAPSAGTTTDFTGVKTTGSGGKDSRWKCPNSGESASTIANGGPYYYRVISTVNIGTLASPNTTNLYKGASWEAVAVPASQYQNWANWWAYYSTRNLMTQSSVSRVFGSLGAATDSGGFGNSIRVAWQNLNDGNFKLPTSTIITSLIDGSGCAASGVNPQTTQQPTGTVKSAPNCYRTAFFNWIFQVGGTSTTPNRASTIRAGQFFQRGSGNTGGTGDLKDPYWDPPKVSGADGLELVCRQNYHMLVTDGYWNESDPTSPIPFQTSQAAIAKLPDGTAYSISAAESRVYWNVQGTALKLSLANIAFNYWATNLRPDLYDPANGKIVPPYMPDSTTGVVTGATSAALEKYFNPKNDPANWPNLVQYMVTLGVPGKLTASDDADCNDASNDLCKLRKGLSNSSGAVGWTTPANNAAEGIDDTWHAAVNSRGAYFNAANPQNLVDQLTNILTNISARNVPATTSGLNTSVLVQGALGFTAGYSSADWSGVFKAISANSDGTVSGDQWDAAALLTDPTKTDPTTRQILTSKEKADGSFDVGTPFKTFSTDLDNLTASTGSSYLSARTLLSAFPSSVGSSDAGQARVDYLRGARGLEGSVYRTRTNLLGAVINSQALFVGAPSSGYRNSWPTGSPEALAMAADTSCNPAAPTLVTCHSYEAFSNYYKTRTPIVYVGANDGMLHAFSAKQTLNSATPPQFVPEILGGAGKEMFAYVPRTIYPNLGNLTAKSGFKFAPTVDATPVARDVFLGGAWHTILVGGLRLGGRGVYALDITDPTQVTEANAGTKVLWEFSADTPAVSGTGNPANLGYTYGQPNIGRLANGKWVVLVPGGYFPDCSKSTKPANCVTLAAASNGYSSLYVLDAQTGAMIRELKTLTTITGVTSGGLSSVVLGDYNNDQVDDVAFAGDLNGNLWRFDLTDPDPTKWQAKVTLVYQPATQGAQPITAMPRLFPDPATNRFIVVFGTGKYLGATDNTSSSASTQSIYGIRDKLDSSGKPITAVHADLQSQTLYQAASSNGINTVRGLTDNALTAAQNGWYIDLNLTSSPGERVVVTAGALFDTNRAIITTLIPGSQDPCTATIAGALMVLNAATGGSGGGLSGPPAPTSWGTGVTGVNVVGGLVNNPPTGGSVPVAAVIGGGKLLIPGLQLQGGGNLNIDDAIWRRRSWRELTNDQ
ncbi:MAG: PilC/PilY family type IV pilus protein [Rhodanobacter sp.]